MSLSFVESRHGKAQGIEQQTNEPRALDLLVVLDRENLRRDDGYSIGNGIYLSTFSKTLAPGLRLGC